MSIMPSSKNLRPYLEAQADRVDAVLAQHNTPGRVVGGTVGPRLIRFFLEPAPHIRFASIERLGDDLAIALRVRNLRIVRSAEGVILEFSNPNPRPVTLLNLLPEAMPMPLATAMLGLTDDGAPLLARLSAPEVAHILISGTTGSGKSALLRTIAASLALTHTSSLLQMLCIDPKGRAFPAFHGIPHLTRKPIVNVPEALEALHSVARVMESRDQRGETPVINRDAIVSQNDGIQGTSVPRIVIFIDELADLVMQGEAPFSDVLTRLVQRGRQAGIHVIAATQHPASALLGSVMRANFPLRLVGRVVSAADACVASGRAGTNAHLLDGRGDFLAVSGGENPVRFQVAYIGEKDLKQQLATLARSTTDVPRLNLRAAPAGFAVLPPAPAELVECASPPLLLSMPAPQPEQSNRVHEAVYALRPQWQELRAAWLGEEWGIKTKLVRLVWGEERRYEGAFAEWIESAVAELEKEYAQTITPSPELNPLPRNRKQRVLAHIRSLQEASYA